MIKEPSFSSNIDSNWIHNDKLFCWHPFTQVKNSLDNLLIIKSKGAYIYDRHNKKYLDAISSWWVNTHGHNHPHITKAISKQTKSVSHVMFSGLTHIPAIKLAKNLVEKLNCNLQHVFYTDNGSTAIEAALKMCIQYHLNKFNAKKNIFLAFKGAYHGDTFGAMSVGKSSGFYPPFSDFLFKVKFIEYSQTYLDVENKKLDILEKKILGKLETYLLNNHQNIAAFIFEPLIQGASGMRITRIEFLQKIIKICKKYSVLCIADEVMTGFGRTGKLFAIDYLEQKPDIICLSKGLTGGTLALGAAIASSEIYNSFLSDNVMEAFLHGHSYTANPIACSAAVANLELYDNKLFEHINNISNIHQENLNWLQTKLNNKQSSFKIKNLRYIGSIAAFEIYHSQDNKSKLKYGSTLGNQIRINMLKEGILIRPLGNIVYILPPYCITLKQIINIYKKLFKVISNLSNINHNIDLF